MLKGKNTRQKNGADDCRMTWMTSWPWKTGDRRLLSPASWQLQPPTNIRRWRHAVTWPTGNRSITTFIGNSWLTVVRHSARLDVNTALAQAWM